MLLTSETIQCQYKDANRGANLFEVHGDRRDDENRRNKDGCSIHEACSSLPEPMVKGQGAAAHFTRNMFHFSKA